MNRKEGDDDLISSPADIDKEMKMKKSRFSIMLNVLVNTFLFSVCFFMVESVFPVSTCTFVIFFIDFPRGTRKVDFVFLNLKSGTIMIKIKDFNIEDK